MIALEHLADGSISDRNFQTLAQLVPDTGGLSVRVRAGSVTSAGAVGVGSGFTVTKNGTGDYTVAVGFSSDPAVIVGAGETPAVFHVAKLHAAAPPNTTGFRVICFTTDGTNTAVDGYFHWIAVG